MFFTISIHPKGCEEVVNRVHAVTTWLLQHNSKRRCITVEVLNTAAFIFFNLKMSTTCELKTHVLSKHVPRFRSQLFFFSRLYSVWNRMRQFFTLKKGDTEPRRGVFHTRTFFFLLYSLEIVSIFFTCGKLNFTERERWFTSKRHHFQMENGEFCVQITCFDVTCGLSRATFFFFLQGQEFANTVWQQHSNVESCFNIWDKWRCGN